MNENQQPAPQPAWRDSDEIDLGRLIDLLLAGKWMIGAIAAGILLLGAIYAFTATHIYRGDVLLQVEQKQASVPGLADLGLAEEVQTSAEVELLRSRMVVGEVVDRLDLTIVAEPEPGLFQRLGLAGSDASVDVGRLEPGPGLQGRELMLYVLEGGEYEVRLADTGETLGRGRVDEPLELDGEYQLGLFVRALDARPGTEIRLRQRDRLAAINYLRRHLDIQERGGGRRGGSGILEVAMEHPDPAFIARVLDALGQSYVRQNVERRSEEARRSLAFLDQQLPELRDELELAEEQYNRFRRENQAVDLSANTSQMLERLVQVESELNQLRIEESEKALRYGAEHPQMRALQNRRRSLETLKAEIEDEVGELPERQQQMLRLRRDVEVNTQLYTGLLNTAQELRVMQAGTVGNVRIVDHAAVGPRPVQPRKALIPVMSLMLGLVVGTGSVFAREMLRRTIVDPESLERGTGYTVYAVVPHSRTQRRNERRSKRDGSAIGILSDTDATDMAVEALRSLRTSLAFALMDKRRNVLAFCSAGPENGKTFLSVNLARLLTNNEQRVLVIDTDLRKGHVHAYLSNQKRSPGLSDVLAGTASFDEAKVSVADGQLDFLCSGTLPPNPSELLMHPAFPRLIEEQRQHYDLVILDTAPIMAVTDGVIAATQAGVLFMVARAGWATEREVLAAIRRLDQNGAPVTGLVVNDFNAAREGYSQYYYYQYEYKHKKA